MKLLAIFYSICTVLDWVMFLAGRASVTNNDLICYKKTVILVNTNLGGLYMLAFSILAYIYATFMWYVFYNVPRSMGLVTSRTVDDIGGLIRSHTGSIYENEENIKTVIRELDYDRKFTKS